MKKNKKPSFSVGTFLADKKGSDVQLFVKESLDENGNIISFPDQAAIVTHYLKLRNEQEGRGYKEKGEAY